MNTRQKVLEDALKIVNGEREKQYGSPEDNFARIADFWGLYLTQLFDGTGVVIELDPKDVAMMMVLFKIARSLGYRDKLDNYVDMIGYAACGAEILERSEEDSKKVKEWVNKVDAAEECTVCGKKDKPDEKCNREDCGQFDACMTAYQHYIYYKAKEASEAINKVLKKNVESAGECSENKDDVFEKLVRESYGEGAHLDCEHCKYELTDEQDYPCKKCTPNKNGGTLFESDARQKIKKVEPVEECRTCDAYKKCAGTGHCYKKEREELSNLSDGEFEALWAERMRNMGGNAEAKCMYEQVEGNPFHIFIVGDCDELTKEEKDKITKKFEDFINAFIDDKKKKESKK